MSNKEKIYAMKLQLDEIWSEFILLSKSQEPVAKLHQEDVMDSFSSLIVQLACVANYED